MRRRDSLIDGTRIRHVRRASDMPQAWSLAILVQLAGSLSTASDGIVAELAVVLVRCPNELSLDDYLPQVAKYGCDVSFRWRGESSHVPCVPYDSRNNKRPL